MILNKYDIDLFYESLENRYKDKIYYLKDRDKFYSIIITNVNDIDLAEFKYLYNEMADTIFKSNSYIIKNRFNDLINTNIMVLDALEEFN